MLLKFNLDKFSAAIVYCIWQIRTRSYGLTVFEYLNIDAFDICPLPYSFFDALLLNTLLSISCVASYSCWVVLQLYLWVALLLFISFLKELYFSCFVVYRTLKFIGLVVITPTHYCLFEFKLGKKPFYCRCVVVLDK